MNSWCFFCISLLIFLNEVASQPPLLEAEQALFPQLLLLREMLHSPDHPRCPPLEPSLPRPFHPRQSRLGAAAPPFKPRGGGRGALGPGSGRRCLRPAALRGRAGLGSRVPEPPGQEQRWWRDRSGGGGGTGAEAAPGPERSRRRRLMTRGRPVTSGGTASVLPKVRGFAPKFAPRCGAGDGDMAAGRQITKSSAGGRRPHTERPR